MERQEPGRRDMGRAKFLERVWQWKAESGGIIVNQLKRLGASCDWSRERFTMDEGLSRAVVKVFVELHREGLIYKDKRLVNWDPKLLTAISDLEVQQIEVKGSLWYLRYPIEGKNFNPDDPSTLHRRRDHAARDDAGRHRRCGASGRRALRPSDRQARHPAAGRPPDSDHRRRICRSRKGLRRGRRSRRRTTSTISRSASGTACRRSTCSTRRAALALVDNEDYLRGLPEGAAQLAEEFARRRPLRRAQADRGAAGGFRLPREDRAEHAHGAAWRPLRRRHRALSDRPVVRRRQDAWRSRRSRRCARARRRSCRRTGKRPISTGWRTSSPGASRASSGGATRSRPGTGRTARCSSPRPKKKPSATRSAITSSRKSSRRRAGARDGARPCQARGLHHARRGRARHLVLLGAVAVLDARLARRHAGSEALLPDQRAGHRAWTSSSSGSPG